MLRVEYKQWHHRRQQQFSNICAIFIFIKKRNFYILIKWLELFSRPIPPKISQLKDTNERKHDDSILNILLVSGGSSSIEPTAKKEKIM